VPLLEEHRTAGRGGGPAAGAAPRRAGARSVRILQAPRGGRART
jgi:hypothetical protein